MCRIFLLIVMMLLMTVVGCDKSSESTPPENNPDGANLLGLTRDHQLHYVIYDSIVSISFDDPDTVYFDTSYLDLQIALGQSNQVELNINGVPHDLLTIDDLGVLHSGQIRPAAQPPDTLFFYPTPIIMPRILSHGTTWYIESPPFTGDSGDVKRTLLYFNYGYFTERRYVGRENVILPTSSYEAYHFQSLLFYDEYSSDTLINVDEYYAANVGLVKLIARVNRDQRLIILLEDE
jgi:hypothetical protein